MYMKTVKRAASAAALPALFFAVMLCVSCARAERDMLSFLRYPLSADCTLTYGDPDAPSAPAHFSLEVTERGSGRLIFTDGELSGGVVTVTPAGAFISEGEDFSAPLDLPDGAPPAAVVAAFSTDHVDVTSETPETETEDGRITAVCAGGTVEITVSDGIPRTLDFTGPCGSYTVTVDKFAGPGLDG